MNGDASPANATAVTPETGSAGIAVAPPLIPGVNSTALGVSFGALARTVTDLKATVARQEARIQTLEKDAATAREWVDKYKPLIEKFVNGPGRLLLKV